MRFVGITGKKCPKKNMDFKKSNIKVCWSTIFVKGIPLDSKHLGHKKRFLILGISATLPNNFVLSRVFFRNCHGQLSMSGLTSPKYVTPSFTGNSKFLTRHE